MATTHPPPPGDPFAALGLTPDATLADVRQAFRAAAHASHPDKGGDAATFRAVRAAYDELRTPARLEAARKRWGKSSSPVFTIDLGDLSDLFAQGLNTAEYPPVPKRRKGDKITLDIDHPPAGWLPGTTPPPLSACIYDVKSEPFNYGVWMAPGVRAVFGPPYRATRS